MPRSVDSEQKPKRTPRKRATSTRARRASVPKEVAEKPVLKKAPRKRVPRREPEQAIKSAPKPVASKERKAPTPIAARKATSKAKRNQLVVVGLLLLAGVGASAAVGFTDNGQIDVNETIEARNERIRSGQSNEPQSVVIPVQNSGNNNLPDGGLVGLGIGTPTPSEPTPATTTASTTDSTASSTEATASSTDSSIEDEDSDPDQDLEEEGVGEVDSADSDDVADTEESPESTS